MHRAEVHGPSVRALVASVAGGRVEEAKPLDRASVAASNGAWGRKLNSSGLSWLALKPDSAAAAAAAAVVDAGAVGAVRPRVLVGDGAGGGGDERTSRTDCDVVDPPCCWAPGADVVDCSTGWPGFDV